MQSFFGKIRLVTRHTIYSTGGSGASFHQPQACLTRLLPNFSSDSTLHEKIVIQSDLLSKDKGMLSVSQFFRDRRPGFFHRTALRPAFASRCITTMGASGKSVSQDTSDSLSEAAPRIKFKRLDKTAKHIMQILDKEAVEEVRSQREIPDIKPGYIIQLKVEVPENKRRASLLKGIVIARRNCGLNTTIRLRRMVAGVGVESLLPLYSPNIKEIKILDKKKVRRAKLYYLRDKLNPLRK